MRAAQISEYGDASVLICTDQAEKPEVSPGKILVEVHAAATNPFDIKVREGQVQSMAALSFPATLGGDFAGVVVAVGEGVTDFEVGQDIYGQAAALSGKGSYAEYTLVRASQAALKPESTDYITAAAYPLVSVSAYQALVDHMDLQAGQSILIHGGAGGIGSMAIQLAKQIGAHVITTAAARDTDYVKSLGADEVIDYAAQDFAELVSNVDAVYDVVGGETNLKSYGVLKAGGTLVSMVISVDEALAAEHQVTSVYQSTKVTTERLTEIAQLIDAGKLTIHVDKTFPLEQAGEALEYLQDSHPRGKVVIKVV